VGGAAFAETATQATGWSPWRLPGADERVVGECPQRKISGDLFLFYRCQSPANDSGQDDQTPNLLRPWVAGGLPR
jgi:hypothetical protein